MVPRYAYAVIALTSASLLAYEVLLTRVCALRLHFHFGFLVVSNCLLGIGASGALLTATERHWKARPRSWVWRACAAYVMTLPLVWLTLARMPIPDGAYLATWSHAGAFAAFNLVATVPFFTGGTAIGLLLSAYATRVHALYGWDLVGAGAGCVAIPLLLWHVGAGGCFMLVLLLGAIAFMCAAPRGPRRASVLAGGAVATMCVLLLPSFDRAAPIAGKGYLDLTADVRAQHGHDFEFSRWSVNSRIDMLRVQPQQRFMFCRGAHTLDRPLPAQKLILQDGSAGTFVSNFSEEPWGLDALRGSLYSLTLSFRPGARVLVIGMGGGNDVWAAKIHDAESIRAIELNQAIVDIHRQRVPTFSRELLDDPRIEMVVDEGRGALTRDGNQYDVIQMTGIDTWTSLTSGGYILAENYLYTTEALQQAIARLADGGILQIIRMAADMETLRLLSNVHTALDGRRELEHSVAALSTGDNLTATLIKNGAFDKQEKRAIAASAHRNGYIPVYLPGYELGTIVEQFVRSDDKQAFIDAFPRDISPTTDDRPYFFNFTRWSDPLDSVHYIDDVTSVSQGNPLFLLVQLGASSVLALVFIIAPLVLMRRRGEANPSPAPIGRWLGFFAAIGVGFIAIEVALMQKLTLVLGQPLYSIVVTLATILLAAGIGSWMSERWLSSRSRRGMWWLPVLLAAMMTAIVVFGPEMTRRLVTLPTSLRVLSVVALIAPLGLALGVPFAHGIRVLRDQRPALIPWAWAVNGSATVIGSIATVVVSMNAGFDAVLLGAAGIYFLAFSALPKAGTLDRAAS